MVNQSCPVERLARIQDGEDVRVLELGGEGDLAAEALGPQATQRGPGAAP